MLTSVRAAAVLLTVVVTFYRPTTTISTLDIETAEISIPPLARPTSPLLR